MHTPGGVGAAASGDITLRASLDAGGASGILPPTATFGAAGSLADLWAAWSSAGAFASGQGTTVTPNGAPVLATHGATSVSVPVPAGATVTLSITFAWYFPDRDHMGVNLGNAYAAIWDSSADVAAGLSTAKDLNDVVTTINNVHDVYHGSLPQWLSDAAINEASHIRGMMYLRDGRMREYEANDCPDVDSEHNDAQRKQVYIPLFPEFERQKLYKWATGAPTGSDGHMPEYLGG